MNMQTDLQIYNTQTRQKETFVPLKSPMVGMYVCGPTVYSDAHLGHARPAVTFDLMYRYLRHLNYLVRYVRNITDVGHLEHDADEGEDKIAQRARLEQIEPMEVVQRYTNSYHYNMNQLNVLHPDIEPRATGHIIEQQQMIKKILDRGYAYECNGSVYFDVEKFNRDYEYGKLSGRKLEDLLEESRNLKGTDEKRHSCDFALWKKATPTHIMRWPSEWGEGFPGWHIECSVMSSRYLGSPFDIHGGGLDLLFPHHECEMAQSQAADGVEQAKYWVHNNMITINGQKMSKSLGNFITLNELFAGQHQALKRSFSPMTVRFFMLQSHYRSPVDFSKEALEGAERGFERLFRGIKNMDKLSPADKSTIDIREFEEQCYEAINDDLNTPVLISQLFEGIKWINSALEGNESITREDRDKLKSLYFTFVYDILGLQEEQEGVDDETLNELVTTILDIRLEAKKAKDFETADKIRDRIQKLGIRVKDTPDGYEWEWSTAN